MQVGRFRTRLVRLRGAPDHRGAEVAQDRHGALDSRMKVKYLVTLTAPLCGMAEDQTPHARHSPPESPPTEFEAFYPTGDIVAAAQDRNQAESVAQALTGLGLPATDMDILDPTFVIQAAEELKRRRGILGRLGALFGDDSYFAAQFVELARKGHPL